MPLCVFKKVGGKGAVEVEGGPSAETPAVSFKESFQIYKGSPPILSGEKVREELWASWTLREGKEHSQLSPSGINGEVPTTNCCPQFISKPRRTLLLPITGHRGTFYLTLLLIQIGKHWGPKSKEQDTFLSYILKLGFAFVNKNTGCSPRIWHWDQDPSKTGWLESSKARETPSANEISDVPCYL